MFEEELGGEVGLSDFGDDFASSLLRELIDETLDHALADLLAPSRGRDGEVEDVKSGFMEFINHESDDLAILFGDHADAVALSQAAEEILFRPLKLEAGLFDGQDFFHIASDKPADLKLLVRLMNFE